MRALNFKPLSSLPRFGGGTRRTSFPSARCRDETSAYAFAITFTNLQRARPSARESGAPLSCSCRRRGSRACASPGRGHARSANGSLCTIDVFSLLSKLRIFVENKRLAAAHAGAEILAGPAEYHDRTAGHVFAAMITDALDHGHYARVAHGEAFAGHTVEIGLAARRAVERTRCRR